jgi:hypothetical protein
MEDSSISKSTIQRNTLLNSQKVATVLRNRSSFVKDREILSEYFRFSSRVSSSQIVNYASVSRAISKWRQLNEFTVFSTIIHRKQTENLEIEKKVGEANKVWV